MTRVAVMTALPVIVLAILAAGCGGGQGLDSGFGFSQSGLPDVDSLEAGLPPRVVSYTSDQFHQVDPQATYARSANATDNGANLVLDSSDGNLAWAIYEFGNTGQGSFFFSDYANGLVIDAQTPASNPAAPFGYWVAAADYGSKKWQFSEEITLTGEQTGGVPLQNRSVTEAQTMFLAVIVHGGAAIEISSVTGDILLTGRTLHHIDSRYPGGDLPNRPVRFKLVAEDENNFYVYGFNKQATLTADPGVIILEQPEFDEGIAFGTVQFPGVGTYEVFLQDADPALDGSLGVCEVYETNLPVLEISITSEDYRFLKNNPYGYDFVPCIFTIDGTEYTTATTRFRGGDARDFPKKSWKVKLPEDAGWPMPEWGYTSKESFNLNAEYTDPTILRDKMSYDLFAMMGVPAPRARFVHLRVNDEFVGVMLDVESPRKRWLDAMGFDNDGQLFSALDNRFETLDSPEEYDGPFERQTREGEPFDDLHNYISTVNNLADQNVYIGLKALMKMNLYRKYMVGNALTSQQRNLRHNYMLYYDDDDSLEWMVIPWDYDFTWGRQIVGIDKLINLELAYDSPIDWGNWDKYEDGNNLMTIYFNNDQYWAEYKAGILESLDTVFTEDIWNTKIDEYLALINNDLMADRYKFSSNEDYDGFIQDLRDYVAGRRDYLAQVAAQ